MKNGRNFKLLMIGVVIFFSGPFLLSTQAYFPCECNRSGCGRNLATCPSRPCGCYPQPPPPPPTLYQPTSPEYDGIIDLTWSSSSGASSYKVYKSDTESGTYTVITTISSLSYTDTVMTGTWWYYVRAGNNNGYSTASNKVAVEVFLQSWYESNENYNLGDFPVNEWSSNIPSEDNIEVVWAPNYNVDMSRKAIRMGSSGYGFGTDMIRFETYTFVPGQSLYLSFNAQMNKNLYTGEGRINLVGNSGLTFLGITFDSYWEEISIEFADGQIGVFSDLLLNRVYDFDIMFIKDPITNLMKYFIFIDQELEFVYEVNTALHPIATYIELSMIDEGPGEFFLDNFFLGYLNNDIFPEEYIEVAIPMYYLYAPDFDSNDPYVDSIDMKYRYTEITTETITTSLKYGVSIGVFSVSSTTQLSDVIQFSGSQYEVSTNGVDLIVFNLIEANKRDITFDLPGMDPDSGASSVTAWYTFDFISQTIKYNDRYIFESEFGLPEDFDECKQEALYDRSMDFQTPGGSGGEWKVVATRELEISYSYTIGVVLGIDINEYVKFNLGLVFTTAYSYEINTEVSLTVRFVGAPIDYNVTTDLFTPLEGSYATFLDLPPYSASQV